MRDTIDPEYHQVHYKLILKRKVLTFSEWKLSRKSRTISLNMTQDLPNNCCKRNILTLSFPMFPFNLPGNIRKTSKRKQKNLVLVLAEPEESSAS